MRGFMTHEKNDSFIIVSFIPVCVTTKEKNRFRFSYINVTRIKFIFKVYQHKCSCPVMT